METTSIIKEFILPLLNPWSDKINKLITQKVEKKLFMDSIEKLLSGNFKKYYTIKNILNRTEPVQFYNIYEPLFIKQIQESKEYNYNTTEKKPIDISSVENLIKLTGNLFLFGDAGSGKSTILHHLFLNTIIEKYKIPIIIEFRSLNERDISLKKYIQEIFSDKSDLSLSDSTFNSLMADGLFLFFFDGFDEVNPTRQVSLSKEIRNLVEVYNENKYVLTSRPMEFMYLLPTFSNYSILPFNEEQRNSFILRQFSEKDKAMALSIIQKIEDPESKIFLSFLLNPLLVSLYILNFQYHPDIPQKKYDFFKGIFDALYSEHDWVSKMGFERKRKSQITKDDFINILSVFAFHTHFKFAVSFTKSNINDTFNTIKKYYRKHFDNDDLLFDLNVSINIFILDGKYYSFPHRAFQEYFVAVFILRQKRKDREHIYDKLTSLLIAGKITIVTTNLCFFLYEMDNRKFIEEVLIKTLNEVESNFSIHQTSSISNILIITKAIIGYDENKISLESQMNSLFNSWKSDVVNVREQLQNKLEIQDESNFSLIENTFENLNFRW